MKRTALSACLVCLSALFLAANTSQALTIPASEDSYTASGGKLSLATNNANSLIVDANRKSYLYFDLSDIPTDAVVRWAKLRLFLPIVQRPGAGLSVHVVASEWNESQASQTQPTLSTGSIGVIPPEKLASRRFVTVDVTSTVQKWIKGGTINGGTINEGFAIQPIVKTGGVTASLMLTSKEGPTFGLPAELDIEFLGQGSAGIDSKTILSGTSAPSSSIGNAGDFYIHTTTSSLYGPKTASGWGAGVSLVGPRGEPGASGAAGPQGIQGIAGAAGPAGPRGLQGETGPQGAPGSDGKTILNGTIAPSLSEGRPGDFYINTTISSIYGPKADSGWGSGTSLVGAQGPPGTGGGGQIAFDQLPTSVRSYFSPSITMQPAVSAGSANLNVQAGGIGTLTYQWMRDGVAIGGGTSAQLPTQGLQSGTYTVVVSNGFSSVTSSSVLFVVPITPTAPTGFALVTGGTLPASSELGALTVDTFYIGKTEVTWGEWQAVRTWAVSNGYTDLDGVGQGVGDSYPVSHVNWYDVVKWCNARSEKEGKTPVYLFDGAVYKSGQVTPIEVPAASGYRLPSEKEWEFAARGGTQTRGYTYSGSNDLGAVGWYNQNSGYAVHQVGKKQANELGIFDMSGNLWEWSGSWHPGFEGSLRVIRGGDFQCAMGVSERLTGLNLAEFFHEFENGIDHQYFAVGFRVVLSSVPELAIIAEPSVSKDGTMITVQAQSVGTLSYQWKRDGAAIAGGTSYQLSTQGLWSGTYTVVVSNGFASVTSIGLQYPPSPIGTFALVTGGTLPESSILGALPVDTFYIGKTEVTWGEWKTVRTWAVANGYTDLANVEEGVGENYPVSYVNWYDVVKWCNARSEKEGKTPVYMANGAVYKTGEVTPTEVASANGYRLPSEKEWEFAARGGTQTKGYTYSGSNDLNAVGWYDINWLSATTYNVKEVGKKQSNELGIFDMSGNVWEWSGSWYPSSEGSLRVIRGGGWGIDGADACAVASRYNYPGGNRDHYGGFRVALSSVPEMVFVAGGTLPASSELGAVPVDTFYIGRTEVTWGEWKTLRTWAVANGYTDLDGVGQGVGDNYPVSDVSWYDVVKWCNARSETEGRTPVYKKGTDIYRTGEPLDRVWEPVVDSSANGYRLPSEREWEFATRGGTQTQGYTYSGSNNLNAVGWWSGNSNGAVHEVGKKLANELGIYDMSGNVEEWSGSFDPDRESPAGIFAERMIRGGGFGSFDTERCAVASRKRGLPYYRVFELGFRVATSGEYALGITAQPSVSLDGTKLSVEAAGAGTLTYQWSLNGVAIAGGTSSQLPTQGLQSGTYTVVVSNGFASLTSSAIQYPPSPIGTFALVPGGTLPASSQLGALPVDTFYIGKTEVTWGEWQVVRTWAVANGYTDLANVGEGVGDSYPVTHVSWYDVVKWCNARSEKEGKTPVYTVDGAVYKIGQVTPTEVASANGYRLPSEKEWEFAARGGTQTQGYTYSGSNDLSAVGWYFDNSGYMVIEVGKKQANELGIYDMSGNQSEWSGSWSPGYEGSLRMTRGGGWYDQASACPTAKRGNGRAPGTRYFGNGFRLALSSVP